jgi:hypothetical protein
MKGIVNGHGIKLAKGCKQTVSWSAIKFEQFRDEPEVKAEGAHLLFSS